MLSWHFEHFINPKVVVPDSKMPIVEYTDEEAWALAMLMMSWRNISLPIMLIPKGKRETLPIVEEKVVEEKVEIIKTSSIDWGEELFESKYCSECHTIGEGVEAGPDLIGVTKKRDFEWLKRMILNPEEMEQTDSIAKELYQEYEEMGMVVEELTEEEVEAIIEYIESFDTNKD
jgi:hypothetical protein